MISIENSPSDPLLSSSCPSTDRNQNQVPELLIGSSNSSSNSDEKKASTTSAYDNKLALVEEEVDLLKSSVDDCNPPPEFSIRDYVYGLRSKDITKNWPFSEENLMLCMKHGVKNLLPPFQLLDSLKNPSIIEKSLPDNGIVTSSNGEPSRQSHQFVSANSQSSQCNPKIDSGNKIPNCVELGTDSLVEVSKKKLELRVPLASHKTETASQAKKCKLMVKLSLVDPAKTNEVITPINFMVSETVASKVCPVCKTFTSSSNTTLNAHIDQCLSGESTMKWTANSKVIKNRVQPRKMRLMVDIYKTAPTCTLEELDRRNGTNWATNSNFPAQEIEFHDEEREKEQKVSNDNGVETGHEGDVYIDSDGTKVRILSVPKIGAGNDHGSQKLLKRKGPKFVAGKKEKKTREEKHHKFLKLTPRGKKFSSPKPRRGFEIRSNQEDNFSVEEDCQEEDTPERSFQSEELELDDDRCFSRALSSSDNPISSPESSERTDTSPYESRDDDYVDHPLLRKRVGFHSKSSPSNKMVELAGQSKNTDDFVVRSNARKLSSLRKNMLSTSRNSMSELRSGVKRKFSALKKTRSFVGPSQVNCLRNQFQDSGHVSQMVSAKKTNVMEIRKTRTGIKISGEQALYVQPRNTIVDSLANSESSGKEIEIHDEKNYLNSEFDSQHSIGLYQGPFSEPERPIFSPQASLDDREKMFSEEDIAKTMNGQTNLKSAEFDYKEMGHGVYFLDVERIPIPGPPGSFLPSPGADMVSEDVQGNSSLTNSRVQSSEDRLDLVDRDSMLDSPISATSTISNPSLTRSDSRSSEKLSVRSVAVEENPIRQVANMVGEKTEATFPEKGSASGLKNDHQPCCCSRKEGVAQSYQESALLRRRTIEWNKRPVNGLTLRPGTFTLSNYPPEKVSVPPENNSNVRQVPLTAPADTSAASPSSYNPVLRLMGKDLMVVKKDQDIASPQLPPPQSSSFDHSNRQFFTAPAATLANHQNKDYQSLHQVINCSFDPEQQNIDFRNYVQPQTPHTPIHAQERSFTNTAMLPGGYMTSNGYGLSGSHLRFMPQAPLNRASNNYQSPKEIIIIDDSPENEADVVHNRSMRSNSVHFPTGYNPRHLNSSYNNQSQGSFFYGGSQAVKDSSFPRPVSRETVHASSPVWNLVPEGSREMNTSTAMWNHGAPEGGISSSATAHLRTTAYYPPSFS